MPVDFAAARSSRDADGEVEIDIRQVLEFEGFPAGMQQVAAGFSKRS